MSQVSTEEVYEKAEEYWASVASDVDGMLGGFQQLHRPDINDSKKFLYQLKSYVSGFNNIHILKHFKELFIYEIIDLNIIDI